MLNDAYMSFVVTGTWRSRMNLSPNVNMMEALPHFRPVEYSPASWVVNARAALTDIDLG